MCAHIGIQTNARQDTLRQSTTIDIPMAIIKPWANSLTMTEQLCSVWHKQRSKYRRTAAVSPNSLTKATEAGQPHPLAGWPASNQIT
jgi:hypothetical protein